MCSLEVEERFQRGFSKITTGIENYLENDETLTLSEGLGESPLLNWIIFCVVGKNCEHPVYGDLAVESVPRFDECSRATEYSLSPLLKFTQCLKCYIFIIK